MKRSLSRRIRTWLGKRAVEAILEQQIRRAEKGKCAACGRPRDKCPDMECLRKG